MKDLRDTTECHERGSILVAAVFDAFFSIYLQRAKLYFEIDRGSETRNGRDLPNPLADALCKVATQTAMDFFSVCVRAIDYLPPVDVTFGDFLRAVMTSEMDYDPIDAEGIRDAWMQAFRLRGILPLDAPYFSEQALCWPVLKAEVEVKGLPFGGPLGLTYREKEVTAKVLRSFFAGPGIMELLQLDKRRSFTLPSFHPLYRIDRAGNVRWDLVVEVVQTEEGQNQFPRRAGTTVILSTHSTGGYGKKESVFLRYVIAKPLIGSIGLSRRDEQTKYFEKLGVLKGLKARSLRLNFGLIHGVN
jgi:hypothetical protein